MDTEIPETIENLIGMKFFRSKTIIIQILPVLVLVIFLMGVSNYFLKPKIMSKHLGVESGFKGWLLAISIGILSHGPIYVWYPYLKGLKRTRDESWFSRSFSLQ